jgi:hypothetical protein
MNDAIVSFIWTIVFGNARHLPHGMSSPRHVVFTCGSYTWVLTRSDLTANFPTAADRATDRDEAQTGPTAAQPSSECNGIVTRNILTPKTRALKLQRDGK